MITQAAATPTKRKRTIKTCSGNKRLPSQPKAGIHETEHAHHTQVPQEKGAQAAIAEEKPKYRSALSETRFPEREKITAIHRKRG